jgi:glycolate oxidase FAD binding subunit
MAHGSIGAEGAGGLRILSQRQLTETATGSLVDAAMGGVARIVESVREAQARRTPLRIVGAGRWLDAGRPVGAESVLSIAPLAGIVDYVPGDLTLTAGAGTTLAEIERATAAHGQWLTLDPFGDDDGTLGATVATASAGPLATGFGTPRDIVLGVEFVTGAAAVVRAGGRVVKNVAGFDLTRLVTGAWGTLGALTEITVRLRARPEVDETVAVAVGNAPDQIAAVAKSLRMLPFTPQAAEVVNAGLASRLGLEARTCLLVRLGGTADAVRAQRASLTALGETRDVTGPLWPMLRGVEPAGSACMRLSRLPSRFADTWSDATRLGDLFSGTLLHGAPLRGMVRCIIPDVSTARAGGRGHVVAGVEERLVRALTPPFDGSRVFERVPGSVWKAFAPTTVSDRLSLGIKAAFDPHGLLNPGILGDRPAR